MLSLFVTFMVVFATSVLFVESTMSVVVVYSVFSCLAMLFYTFQAAPDVAITEAAVGSAISTIFFMLATKICKSQQNQKIDKIIAIFALIVCVSVFIVLCYLALKMQPYGNPGNVVHKAISQYYLKNTIKDFGIPSSVTAILAGYRGVDTLFETVVIFCAAMGVRSILSNEEEKK